MTSEPMNFINTIHAAWPDPEWTTISIIFVTIVVTYTIFGMMGFGSALIAAPILALRMPLSTVVPLLALLDVTAALINVGRLGSKIDKREILWLTPLMALGSGVGIAVLLSAPPKLLLLGLGLFVIAYSLYRLFFHLDPRRLSRYWVFPFGLIGGLFSGMFGSGGFIYSIYLSHRGNDKDIIRATMTAMTGLSTMTRVVIFVAIGTFADFKLLLSAAFGVPALIIGIYCGHHITSRLPHEHFLRLLCVMLLGTGSLLVWRALHV
jgi:uncharacterized membrane protein YfcA